MSSFPDLVVFPKQRVKIYLLFSESDESKVRGYVSKVILWGMLAETATKRRVNLVSGEFEGPSFCLVDMFSKDCYCC